MIYQSNVFWYFGFYGVPQYKTSWIIHFIFETLRKNTNEINEHKKNHNVKTINNSETSKRETVTITDEKYELVEMSKHHKIVYENTKLVNFDVPVPENIDTMQEMKIDGKATAFKEEEMEFEEDDSKKTYSSRVNYFAWNPTVIVDFLSE